MILFLIESILFMKNSIKSSPLRAEGQLVQQSNDSVNLAIAQKRNLGLFLVASFIHLSSASVLHPCWVAGQQLKQRDQDSPLAGHSGQLLGRNRKLLLGQQRNIVPPACPGSPQGSWGAFSSTRRRIVISSHSMPFVSTKSKVVDLSRWVPVFELRPLSQRWH